MKKKQPKTVKAWAFAARFMDSTCYIQSMNEGLTKSAAESLRAYRISDGYTCGPIVRIEVPAPMEKSK